MKRNTLDRDIAEAETLMADAVRLYIRYRHPHNRDKNAILVQVLNIATELLIAFRVQPTANTPLLVSLKSVTIQSPALVKIRGTMIKKKRRFSLTGAFRIADLKRFTIKYDLEYGTRPKERVSGKARDRKSVV